MAPPGLRLLLFAGKGGVGKTSCACATALALARRDPQRRILLLSSDPAHSLADALQTPLGDDLRKIPGTRNLLARELDAEAAFAALRAHYRAGVEELFSGLSGRSALDPVFDRAVVFVLL